jgi:hypothetical protein
MCIVYAAYRYDILRTRQDLKNIFPSCLRTKYIQVQNIEFLCMWKKNRYDLFFATRQIPPCAFEKKKKKKQTASFSQSAFQLKIVWNSIHWN